LSEPEKLVREIAKDFRVPPPKITVSTKKMIEECGDYCGCYDYLEKQLIFNEECFELSTLLHEFAHHLQFIRAGEDARKAFTAIEKNHCERPHEIEAKGFAEAYRIFYSDWWKKIVGKS